MSRNSTNHDEDSYISPMSEISNELAHKSLGESSGYTGLVDIGTKSDKDIEQVADDKPDSDQVNSDKSVKGIEQVVDDKSDDDTELIDTEQVDTGQVNSDKPDNDIEQVVPDDDSSDELYGEDDLFGDDLGSDSTNTVESDFSVLEPDNISDDDSDDVLDVDEGLDIDSDIDSVGDLWNNIKEREFESDMVKIGFVDENPDIDSNIFDFDVDYEEDFSEVKMSISDSSSVDDEEVPSVFKKTVTFDEYEDIENNNKESFFLTNREVPGKPYISPGVKPYDVQDMMNDKYVFKSENKALDSRGFITGISLIIASIIVGVILLSISIGMSATKSVDVTYEAQSTSGEIYFVSYGVDSDMVTETSVNGIGIGSPFRDKMTVLPGSKVSMTVKAQGRSSHNPPTVTCKISQKGGEVVTNVGIGDVTCVIPN